MQHSDLLKFVPWISITLSKVFLARGGFTRNPLRLDVAFPVWPRSDTGKQNDGIGLTQTRPRVFRRLLTGGDVPEDDISVSGRTILGIVSNVHTRSGLSRMDAITALASWPKSIDEIAHAVADPDSPPTVAEIRDVARAIGDGDVRIIVNGDRTNLRLTQHVILGCLRLATMVQEEGDGGPVIPKQVMSYWINALLAAVGALAAVVLLIILYR